MFHLDSRGRSHVEEWDGTVSCEVLEEQANGQPSSVRLFRVFLDPAETDTQTVPQNIPIADGVVIRGFPRVGYAVDYGVVIEDGRCISITEHELVKLK